MHSYRSSAADRTAWRRVAPFPVAAGAVIALAAGVQAAPAAPQPLPSAPGAAGVVPALAGAWRLLPRAPVTRLPDLMTTVWTGRQVIIHGIHFGATSATGVTFGWRPASRTWARLANGPRPLQAQGQDAAVWTGSRMLEFGLTSGSYNPAANSWRPIARPPVPPSAITGWTGHEAIAWEGACCGMTVNSAEAYNPATGTWRTTRSPLQRRDLASGAWTGRDLVVAGGYRFAAGGTLIFAGAAAYNPATRTWRTIAPMPRREYGATAVWDGREVLFIGGTRARVAGPPARGEAYNPATNRWRLLPAMAYPRAGFAAVWDGRHLLVWGGLTAAGVPPPHGEAYTPAANTWSALPAAPLPGRQDPAAAWTGRQMVIWGGSLPTGRTFLDGAAYTPPPPPSTQRPGKYAPHHVSVCQRRAGQPGLSLA